MNGWMQYGNYCFYWRLPSGNARHLQPHRYRRQRMYRRTTFRIMPYPKSDIFYFNARPGTSSVIRHRSPACTRSIPTPVTTINGTRTETGRNVDTLTLHRHGGRVFIAEITDVNGCISPSNSISVIEDCSGGGYERLPFLANLDFTIQTTPTCDVHNYQNTSSGFMPEPFLELR